MKRREKKSESLDIRLPHQQKLDFMAATKQRGETASQALRRYIASYIEQARLDEQPNPVQEITMTLAKHRLKTIATAAGAAIGVFSISALPSAADSTAFDALDKNNDGVITEGEIAPGFDAEIIAELDTDGSGGVSREELEAANNTIVIESTTSEDGENEEVFVRKVIRGLDWTDSEHGEIHGVISTNSTRNIRIERVGDGEELSREEILALVEQALDGEGIEGTDGRHMQIFIHKDHDEEIIIETEESEED